MNDQKTNWIILKSKDRGIDYGVGTFIKQLSKELEKQKTISVFILEIGLTKSQTFSINHDNGITILEVPVAENHTGTDTKKNQEKLSRNIARVVSQYLPSGNENIIHMNYLFQYFVANALRKEISGKVIFTQHVFALEQQLAGNYFDIESEVYSAVDKIITVTQHGKSHLINKEVDADRIEVIYNGIDPGHFNNNSGKRIKEKYGLGEAEKIILYSGRIDPIKGLDYLCRAMNGLVKKIPGSRLVIAGNGNYEQLIQSARNFSANISYLGFIPFEDVVALYHEADIGVIPSLEEHCSYVALEMLHSGLPVVASNLGGLKEIFIHNENALLADTVKDKSNLYGIVPGVEELENHMYSLLTNKDLRIKFARNAKKRANGMFTSEVMANNYLKLIENLNQNTYE
ncbi:MAG: glycosyltransferase family 4 protein [Mariniphaga sp.]|nr:glycosyltransferase family 4 protein [Mariniphaga sp.]